MDYDALKRVLAALERDDLLGEYQAVQYVPPDGTFQVDILVRLGDAFRFDDLQVARITFASPSIMAA